MQEANFFERIKGQMADSWKHLICPERSQYELGDLGPVIQSIEGLWYHRHDYTVPNSVNHQMHCSFFQAKVEMHRFDHCTSNDTNVDSTASQISSQFDGSQ